MVARSEAMASTRERIVKAALKLLLEQAYENVTLVAIAEAAGVSHQTVLNHFTSKENVGAAAAEVLSRQTQDVRIELYRTANRARSPFWWASTRASRIP